MKRLFVFALCALVFSSFLPTGPNAHANTQIAASAIPELDLGVLIELARRSRNAEHFELLINELDSGNGLDLDQDGYVDYLRVEEYSRGRYRGFSIWVDLSDGTSQEVARIEFLRIRERVRVVFWGNPYVYGRPMYYSCYWPFYVSCYLPYEYCIVVYLWGHHPMWRSPWHYNYWPSYYHRRPPRHDHGRAWTPRGGRRESIERDDQRSRKHPNRWGDSNLPVAREGLQEGKAPPLRERDGRGNRDGVRKDRGDMGRQPPGDKKIERPLPRYEKQSAPPEKTKPPLSSGQDRPSQRSPQKESRPEVQHKTKPQSPKEDRPERQSPQKQQDRAKSSPPEGRSERPRVENPRPKTSPPRTESKPKPSGK